MRKIGTYNVLSEEGLYLIEENADRILKETGMEFLDDPDILRVFKEAGCDVQGSRVRFEPDFCRKTIQANARRTLLIELAVDQSTTDGAHAFYSHPVFQDDNVIGVITSAAYGHRCKKFLAFALLREHTNLSKLSVEILGERYQAHVLEFVPVDPTNQLLQV